MERDEAVELFKDRIERDQRFWEDARDHAKQKGRESNLRHALEHLRTVEAMCVVLALVEPANVEAAREQTVETKDASGRDLLDRAEAAVFALHGSPRIAELTIDGSGGWVMNPATWVQIQKQHGAACHYGKVHDRKVLFLFGYPAFSSKTQPAESFRLLTEVALAKWLAEHP